MTAKELLKDVLKEGMEISELKKELEKITIPEDNSSEIERLKNALSKSNSEAADYKKQLREKMSAEELKEKENAEKQEKLQSDYDALLRKVSISENKSKLIGIGYDEKLAEETALAMIDGNLDKVFENQKKHMETVEKNVRYEILKGTPKPSGGNSEKTITKEEFDKMGYMDRLKLFKENENLYNELNGGNE